MGAGEQTAHGHPTLAVVSERVATDGLLELRGSGWPHCPIALEHDGGRLAPAAILLGGDAGGALLPDPDGAFAVRLFALGWRPGTHRVEASSAHASAPCATASLEVEAPRLRADGAPYDKPYARARHFFGGRFRHLGAVPPGLRQFQVDQVRALREQVTAAGTRDAPSTGVPLPTACNWTPVGPSALIVNATTVYSGRATSIAFDPTDARVVYAGTAGGGVWKSTDGGESWTPKSDYQVSLAIGALAVDPGNPRHVLAGTGQYNNQYLGTYYGNGVLRSDDAGETWAETGAAQFPRAEISHIAFDPTDAAGQRVLLSSSAGVFESTDGGTNWSSLRTGDASGLALFHPPSGAATDLVAVAAFARSGIWTATRTSSGWGAWTQVASAGFPAAPFDRITLGQQRADPRVIYALFGNNWNIAGMARTLDGVSWTKVDVRLDVTTGWTSTAANSHVHSIAIPGADLIAAPVARTYTTSAAGTPAHTHTVTLTAAQVAAFAGGAELLVTTDADATGHQHSFDVTIVRQLAYDACVGVHPTDPNTVFLGEAGLWRTTTGGGAFERLPILHSDHHGFAFEPGSAVAWICSDGGVYRSTDNGSTWVHRNRDLATLEYISIAQHPDWETLLLGGTQDNGTHRYTGTPAWRLVAGGDGGFAAIDPVRPARMYHQFHGSGVEQSDDAGTNWSDAGLSGVLSPFYSAFAIDPSNHQVCWFGGYELWRRDYGEPGGGSWRAVTSGISTEITALAVDPSDSTRIYVGAGNGRVWSVQRTGTTWALADVTRTDVSSGLPLVAISDLAVDRAGVVWASIASVYYTNDPVEYSSDHVFRRAPADAQFASRSTGLAQGNPVNTIAIDPASASRLFVGCDVGVFRTDDAGLHWAPWDAGIPNAPVFDLQLHHPRRLLRAATHGRSVWERPIDATSCPLVDLYVRDDPVDSGRVQPTPSGVPDPLDPGTTVWWWQSPDVKVDAPEPAFQTPSPIADYVSFEAGIAHRNPRRSRINRFYAQVHNRGVRPATNVQVRAFFAGASTGLPILPSDFWTGGHPWVGTPLSLDWIPIGPTRTIPVLEPAKPGIVEWDWLVLPIAPEHSCLLVLTSCQEDPLDGGGILNPGQFVTERKQVALRNLAVLDAVPGSSQPQTFLLRCCNTASVPILAAIDLHWGTLPLSTRLIALPDRAGPSEVGSAAAAGVLRDDGFPDAIDAGCGHLRGVDRSVRYELERGKHHEHLSVSALIPELAIRPRTCRIVAFTLQVSEPLPPLGAQFNVVQRVDGRVLGGCSYLLRPRPFTISDDD